VAIQNQRFFCVPGFGRNPTLIAEGFNRRYLFPIREFGDWTVKRPDGSVVATLRKQRSIDDGSDAVDVSIILLLRAVALIYSGLVNEAVLMATKVQASAS
jgi:hypothetical protein